jgi:hypothetical protein
MSVLANGGITTVFLKDAAEIVNKTTFPLFLTELRNLRHLSLDRWLKIPEDYNELRSRLINLPKSLESLSLLFPRAIELLIPSPAPGSLLHKLQTTDKEDKDLRVKVLEELQASPKRLPNLSEVFPSLKSFSIKVDYTDLFPHDLLGFPDTLTSLEVLGNNRFKADEWVPNLPRSLVHFGSSFQGFQDPESAKSLPPALTSLKMEWHNFSVAELEAMPKTLTQIDPPSFMVTRPFNELPPHLRGLSITDYLCPLTMDMISRLPTTVEKIMFNEVSLKITTPLIALLPRTLVELQLKFGDAGADLSDIDRVHWPANLRKLIFKIKKRGVLVKVPLDFLATLPSSLTFIRLEGLQFQSEASKKSLSDANVSLTEESADSLSWNDALPHFSRNGENSFPWLQYLKINDLSEDLDLQLLKHLPSKSLTHLSLVGQFRSESTFWESLPKSITRLRLNCSDDCETTYDGLAESLPNLVDLRLVAGSVEVFKQLPKNCHTLYILDISDALSAEQFQDLPRSLTTLRIPDAEYVAPDSVSALPKTLKHLKLGNIEWPGEAAKDLPPGLLDLESQMWPYLGDEHIELLPRTLQQVFIESTAISDSSLVDSALPNLRYPARC